ANPHQWVSSELWLALRSCAPPGFTVLEAAGVRLPDGSLLIPDLIVVARPKAETLGMTMNAAADIALAIEIVSPGSHTLDRVTKPTLYAQAGIPNFWRVEVDHRILVYRLAGDAYAEVAAVHPGQPLTTDEPFPMALDPSLLAE
ncbi:MAG: Uma2 family endonuclease, partial [Actinomycetota bacterium]